MAFRVAPLEAGERDKQVTIQFLTEATGSSRFPKDDWTMLPSITMFASKRDLGGRERFAAAQLSTPADLRWEINYRADMDPDVIDVPKKRRLVYKGRAYDIVSASQIGRNEGIELLTMAKVA